MFEEELRRLQTDYIDYYLMHMLTDLPTWEKLKKLGMEDWIREKKASGEIRNIGFSYHGRSDMFMQLIDAYDWDFCQIQYNYMDEHSQAGVEGLRYAHARGDSGDYYGAAAAAGWSICCRSRRRSCSHRMRSTAPRQNWHSSGCTTSRR